jgi:hypothetical protein
LSQRPRGENDRQQDGPAALIDDPQPAHRLARLQADQLGGIDLPDLVGLLGASAIAGAAPAAWGGVELGAEEPALQGARGGDGGSGEAASEQDANQPGTPGGVIAPEVEGNVVKGRRGRGLPRVARGEGLAPLIR